MINPYAVMYDAKMTIRRWQDVEKDGFTAHELIEISSGRPCRYSSSGQATVGTPAPSIQNKHTLFCGLDEDIREGDEVMVTMRTGKQVTLKLGECHPYTYQWQCEVEREDTV
nr:MAG TPA: hypothetical protein [Caudoviricetes sp.]